MIFGGSVQVVYIYMYIYVYFCILSFFFIIYTCKRLSWTCAGALDSKCEICVRTHAVVGRRYLFPMEAHDLSLLLLLRLAEVSLPPVLESWRFESLCVLHELQEIFAQSTDDKNELQLKSILRQAHDFDLLARSRSCMLDAWRRFVRRNQILPRHIQAAVMHWTWKKFHASLTVSQIRDRSFLLLNASGASSGWSWDSHCSEVLRELHEWLGAKESFDAIYSVCFQLRHS